MAYVTVVGRIGPPWYVTSGLEPFDLDPFDLGPKR
jgi:hypothetical protein